MEAENGIQCEKAEELGKGMGMLYGRGLLMPSLLERRKSFFLSQRDWINWEFRINIHVTINVYKLDNQQDLLYSAGNYIQYLVITYNGKESEE